MIILQSVLLVISLLLLQVPAEALLLVQSIHAFELVFEGCTYTRAWLHDLESATHTHDSADHQLVIAFSLHLAEPVDWLLYEYRLGEMGNATFVRLSILLWTGSLIFPKAMHSVWQGLLNNMHAFSRASKKWSFCIRMPEWELCMCSLERNSENVCMCVSKFQMYSIYQPHYPYVINEHQNFQPYSKQFSC